MDLATAAAVSLLVQFGHNGIVGAVDISPDGKLIVSGGNDNAARLWDADSGRLLRVLTVPGDQNVVGVRFLPGAQAFVTASQNGFVRQWDVDTGAQLRVLQAGMIHAMDISADGGRMVIAGWQDGASVWDLRTFLRVQKIPAGSSPIMAAAISDDGHTVALGARSGEIRLVTAHTGQPLRSWQAHRAPEVAAAMVKAGVPQQPPHFKKLDLSPDGRLLVSAAMQDLEQSARVWDVATGTQVARLGVQGLVPGHVSFTPDGNHVLFGGFDLLQTWDVATWKPTRS